MNRYAYNHLVDDVFQKACSAHHRSKKCKSCAEYKKWNNQLLHLHKKSQKIPPKLLAKYRDANIMCEKCIQRTDKSFVCNAAQLKQFANR